LHERQIILGLNKVCHCLFGVDVRNCFMGGFAVARELLAQTPVTKQD
jgi:hypothetical protein